MYIGSMSAEDPYFEFYVTSEEWWKLREEEERERVEFGAVPPQEAQVLLRKALPMDGVIARLDAGPESF